MTTKKKIYLHATLGILLASIVSEAVHTNIGIPAPSYGFYIDFIAYATKPLEALGMAIIFYLLGDRLPTQSLFVKGVLLGCLILLVEGMLIRQPLMNLLFSDNTFSDVFLRQLQIWLHVFVMSIIIAYAISPLLPGRK